MLIRLSKNNQKKKKQPKNCIIFKLKNFKNQRQISINKVGNFCAKTVFHEYEHKKIEHT